MAPRLSTKIRAWVRRTDPFTLFLVFSITLHGAAYGAYFISSLPSFADDDSVYDANAAVVKDVEVDFLDLPPSVPLGGDSNPTPVEKEEWLEGTGTDRPDAENTDVNVNRLSGDGTDPDGYMFADLSDRPPEPIIDFDLNKFFPPAARSANITRKTVVVQLQVNDDGSLKSARIISPPSGYGFDEAAMKVLDRIRFRPGKIGGRPVKMVLRLPITFVLED
jgi:periplasmic protein TonB